MALFWRFSLLLSVCYTLHCCMGNEDSDCSYWYSTVPRNNSECNPNGTDVRLQCRVYVPHDNSTNVTVNWYRNTGTNQTQLHSNPPDYNIVGTIADVASFREDLFLDIYDLTIHTFDTSDNGFYWCEIQVNNTSLLPSPSAYVAVNSVVGNPCMVEAFHRNLGLGGFICAENQTITNSSDLEPTPTSISAVTIMTSPMVSMTPSSTPTTTPTVQLVIIIAPAAGGFVILVVCFLLVIACCCCACRRRRRRSKKLNKPNAENEAVAEFNLYEPTSPTKQYSSVNNTDQGVAEGYSIQPMDKSVESHTYDKVEDMAKSVESHTYDKVEDMAKKVESHTYDKVEDMAKKVESHTYDKVEDIKILAENTPAKDAHRSNSKKKEKAKGPQYAEIQNVKKSDETKERKMRHDYDEVVNPSMRQNPTNFDDHSYQEVAKDVETKPTPFDVYSSPGKAAYKESSAAEGDHFYHVLDNEITSSGGKKEDLEDDDQYDKPIVPERGVKPDTPKAEIQPTDLESILFDDPSYAIALGQPQSSTSVSNVPAPSNAPSTTAECPPIPPHASKPHDNTGRSSPKYENSEVIAENKKAGNKETTNGLFDDPAYETGLK